MANEGIELFLYDKLDPRAFVTNIPSRIAPRYLEEILGIGGGSFTILKDDDIVSAAVSNRLTYSNFNYRDVVKVSVNGTVVGAFLVKNRNDVLIGEGELASQGTEISGPGLKAWFDDAVVYPASEDFGLLNSGISSNTRRVFSFASARGTWYTPSDWHPTFNMCRKDAQATLGKILVADAVLPGASSDEAPATAPDATTQRANSWFSPGYQEYGPDVQNSWWWDAAGFHRKLSSIGLSPDFAGAFYPRYPEILDLGYVAYADVSFLTGAWQTPAARPGTGIHEGELVYYWWDWVSNEVRESQFTVSVDQPAPPSWSDPNPWANNPSDWPEDGANAQWMWDRETRPSLGSAPIGDVYFRYEFTINSSEPTQYGMFVTADDSFVAYIDGQEVLSSLETNSYIKTFHADVSLSVGSHVIAIRAHNGTVGQAGVLFALIGAGIIVVPKVLSGDFGWVCQGYPVKPPGWTVGELLTTLILEAQSRSVVSMSNLNIGFTNVSDSAGATWDRGIDWSFDVGSTYSDVVVKIEEVAADIHITPDYSVKAYASRGVNKTVPPNAVALFPAHDVTSASQEGKLENIANTLLVISDDGWFEGSSVSASITRYGRIEGYLAVSSTKTNALIVATSALEKVDLPNETYSLSFVVDNYVPWSDFGVGDKILVPDVHSQFELVGQRVSSLAVTEEDGNIRSVIYSIEFGNILKTPEQKLSRWLQSMVNGTLNGVVANAGRPKLIL